MDLELLEHFVVLAETMNLSKAAQQMFLTQPTLSRQMASLEQELGVMLFIRYRRILHLSPAGELLKKRAPELLEHARQIQSELEKLDQDGKRTINIASMGFCDPALNKYINAFRKNNDYEVELHFQEPKAALQELLTRRCDVAFVTEQALNTLSCGEREQCISCLVETAYPRAVVSLEHRLAGRKSIRLSDLKDETLITGDDEVSYSNLERFFTGAFFFPKKLRRAGSLSALRYQIRKEQAVGILLDCMAADVLDQYAALEIEDFALPESLCLVCRRDADSNVRSFLQAGIP